MFRGGDQVEIVGFFNAAIEVERFVYQVKAADADQTAAIRMAAILMAVVSPNRYGVYIAGAKMLPPALLVIESLKGGVGDTFLYQSIPFRGQAFEYGRAGVQLRIQFPSDS
jgi:hypothetical protein